MELLAGRVVGAHPGERIVIYARSGPWWVQPQFDQPFVTINSDATWSTQTHLGFEYAALLVQPGYQPPKTMDAVPSQGGKVTLVAIVKGTGKPAFAPTKPLHFAGYDWFIRTTPGYNSVNNLYSGDNVWTDARGAMHLRISRTSNGWACAQVSLNRSLGYGAYSIVAHDTSHLEPAAVFSMYTYDELGDDPYFREMDFEVSRWGDVSHPTNAQFSVQPYYVPGDLFQFNIPTGTLKYSMNWESGIVTFKTSRLMASGAAGAVVSQHEFTSGVPMPGQETLHLNLYFVPSEKYPLRKDDEVVIEKFEYLP